MGKKGDSLKRGHFYSQEEMGKEGYGGSQVNALGWD